MARFIAFSNQKGGVAKTTTTNTFAAGLKNRGYRVLAIDLDPQGNLSSSVESDYINLPTIYNVLKNEVPTQDAIQKLSNFDIIPANIMLAGIEAELATMTGKEYRLIEALETVKNNYDYIVIDTPPSLGLLTVNAFTVANEIIIPSTAGIFAAAGIQQLYNTLTNVKKYCNPNIEIRGILITKYNPRTIISQDLKKLTQTIGKNINAAVFNTIIRSSVIIEEAQANRTDIFAYKKDSLVTKDYDDFIDEYLEMIK